jgi:hypothetical protein
MSLDVDIFIDRLSQHVCRVCGTVVSPSLDAQSILMQASQVVCISATKQTFRVQTGISEIAQCCPKSAYQLDCPPNIH